VSQFSQDSPGFIGCRELCPTILQCPGLAQHETWICKEKSVSEQCLSLSCLLLLIIIIILSSTTACYYYIIKCPTWGFQKWNTCLLDVNKEDGM